MNKNWDQISVLFHYENGGRHKDFEFTYSFFTFFRLEVLQGCGYQPSFLILDQPQLKVQFFTCTHIPSVHKKSWYKIKMR